MFMKATYKRYILDFKKPSGTSRGILEQKETWFLILSHDGRYGIGECAVLRGLSFDDRPDYERQLQWVCDHIHLGEQQLWDALSEFPSIQFGVEMAFLSLQSESPFLLLPSAFTKGIGRIPTNGLVWMGTEQDMKQQIDEKIAAGYDCVKLKIGALDFASELSLLRYIRMLQPADTLQIRVDANGAFTSDEALYKLRKLSGFEIHSIEQPLSKNDTDNMAELCKIAPLPVALDEELIGVLTYADKEQLLQKIRPQYIVLKPSFIGGFRGTKQWITLAQQYNIGWWITSALESNIGLNAIAQWTFMQQITMAQGLGTGGLYTNNIESPLEVADGKLWYRADKEWEFDFQTAFGK